MPTTTTTPTAVTTIQHPQLSPEAQPFVSSTQVKRNRFDIQLALGFAEQFLSKYDFRFLTEIMHEWNSLPTLSSLLSHWKSYAKSNKCSISSIFRVLHFNVRGLGERWEEVLLLLDKYKVDCVVLNEVGVFDRELINQAFMNYRSFYQKGENSWGGVLILVKTSLTANRIKCETPNVCVIDIKMERVVRIIGVYAPKSKTWSWNVLSPLITNGCCVIGDFNVDINSETDEKNAKEILGWAE